MPAYSIGITDINTQVRRLGYISAILRALNEFALSEAALLNRLEHWSVRNASALQLYRYSQGQIRITRGHTASRRYLDLAVSLGLVGRMAGACRITRFGKVVQQFLSPARSSNPFELGLPERVLYLYWLLSNDSDRLIVVLSMLDEMPNMSLNYYQRQFQERYIEQLNARRTFGRASERSEILAVRERVKHLWKSPERYAESIVPPRLNWLADLDLATIVDACGTPVALTRKGTRLFRHLPSLGNSGSRTVTDHWLLRHFFGLACSTEYTGDGTHWSETDWNSRLLALTHGVNDAYFKLRRKDVPAVSLMPALQFMVVQLADSSHTWANLDQLRHDIDRGASSPAFGYDIRFSQRENEAYLVKRV